MTSYYTSKDVEDAYFAKRCIDAAKANRATPEEIAVEGIEVYDLDSNNLDEIATQAERERYLADLRHGQEILSEAKLLISRKTTVFDMPPMVESPDAPTIQVWAGHIATSEARRDITLQVKEGKQTMTKQLITVDRDAVVSAIKNGDSSSGAWYVFVKFDPPEAWVDWKEYNSWDNPNADDRMQIPSLVPEGSGDYWHDIQDTWERDARYKPGYAEMWAAYQAAKQAAEDEEESTGRYSDFREWDWIIENDPDWYEAFDENAIDWLVSALENALNGYGDDLSDPDPWRTDPDSTEPSVDERFLFEIK